MIKTGNDRLAWTAADRALQAADASGELLTQATARRSWGIVLRRAGTARQLVIDTAGDSGMAIEHARRIDPAAIPVVERRAGYYVDIARAFHQWGKPEQCYRALLAAEQASPDEVRYRKPIREITVSLLRHPVARRLSGLSAFARRTGVPI
jgi:hypothetical protein